MSDKPDQGQFRENLALSGGVSNGFLAAAGDPHGRPLTERMLMLAALLPPPQPVLQEGGPKSASEDAGKRQARGK